MGFIIYKLSSWTEIKIQNIESAWRATGLIHYNPANVLKKLETRKKYTSTNICSSVSTPLKQSTFVSQTRGNIDQVERIDNLVSQFRNQILDTSKLALFSKLIKEAKLAMADCIIFNTTSAEPHEANVRKKKTGSLRR